MPKMVLGKIVGLEKMAKNNINVDEEAHKMCEDIKYKVYKWTVYDVQKIVKAALLRGIEIGKSQK